MRLAWVLPGIVLLGMSFLIPLVFLSFNILPFGHLSKLSQGIDILCCCGIGIVALAIGAALLVMGLASKVDAPPK